MRRATAVEGDKHTRQGLALAGWTQLTVHSLQTGRLSTSLLLVEFPGSTQVSEEKPFHTLANIRCTDVAADVFPSCSKWKDFPEGACPKGLIKSYLISFDLILNPKDELVLVQIFTWQGG